MSRVTNVVVQCAAVDDQFLPAVNKWLAEFGPFSLKEFPEDASGGTKRLEVILAAGAMNYFFATEIFIDYILKYPWQDRFSVAVLIQPEDAALQVYSHLGTQHKLFL